jgi:lipoprotein-anchoring transpeptidase ErfK/SrfK
MRKQILVAIGAIAGILFSLQAAQAEMRTYYDNALQKFVTYDVQAVMARGAQARGTSYTPIPRETVFYDGPYKPGTIVVNTKERRLYLVEDHGKALKYGIGVGREGFTWSGTDRVSRKAEWPGWTPPAVMIAREKAKGRVLPAHMKGGINNPLGARALYIGARIYRIHGSNEPWTIGHAVSSGCIRLTNKDIIDLYDRVKVGTRVVVLN